MTANAPPRCLCGHAWLTHQSAVPDEPHDFTYCNEGDGCLAYRPAGAPVQSRVEMIEAAAIRIHDLWHSRDGVVYLTWAQANLEDRAYCRIVAETALMPYLEP